MMSRRFGVTQKNQFCKTQKLHTQHIGVSTKKHTVFLALLWLQDTLSAPMNIHEDGASVGSGSSMSSQRRHGGGGDDSQLMGSSTEGSNKSNGATVSTLLDPNVATLVHRETTGLSKARMIMLVGLVISTVATAVGCNHFLKEMERQDFSVRVSVWYECSLRDLFVLSKFCLPSFDNAQLL
jgi:hypothetical protein